MKKDLLNRRLFQLILITAASIGSYTLIHAQITSEETPYETVPAEGTGFSSPYNYTIPKGYSTIYGNFSNDSDSTSDYSTSNGNDPAAFYMPTDATSIHTPFYIPSTDNSTKPSDGSRSSYTSNEATPSTDYSTPNGSSDDSTSSYTSNEARSPSTDNSTPNESTPRDSASNDSNSDNSYSDNSTQPSNDITPVYGSPYRYATPDPNAGYCPPTQFPNYGRPPSVYISSVEDSPPNDEICPEAEPSAEVPATAPAPIAPEAAPTPVEKISPQPAIPTRVQAPAATPTPQLPMPQPPAPSPTLKPSPVSRPQPTPAAPPNAVTFPPPATPAATPPIPPPMPSQPAIEGVPGVTSAPPFLIAPSVLPPPPPTAPPAPREGVSPATPALPPEPQVKTILINFNNVSVIELLRFISKISNKNFIFEEGDLQFNVTIVSEEPTSLENIMSALLQELRIHGLELLEQGNNLVIHRNPTVNSIAKVVAENLPGSENVNTSIVTQVFRLNTADPEKIAIILRPMLSARALIEVFQSTNSIIITDIVSNVQEVSQLIKSLDAPNNGLLIGQYVVHTGNIDSLIQLAQRIMQPISPEHTLTFVPHRSANSIFIISTPFLLERTMAILQHLDQNQGVTRIFNLKDLKFEGEGGAAPGAPGGVPAGRWELDGRGNWVFRTLQPPGNEPPQGYWTVDEEGHWRFQPGAPPKTPGFKGSAGPEGRWAKDEQGNWTFQLNPGSTISPEQLMRPQFNTADLPIGHIQRTQFYLHKLRYRKGEQIQISIGRIAEGLRLAGSNNADLIASIESVQWIESSNSLMFTGTAEALDKVAELVSEIDTPLRQIFLEMLIIETDISDSLEYAVNWGTRFGGGDWSGSQAFLSPGIGSNNVTVFPQALDTATPPSVPSAASLARVVGFSQGIIGRNLSRGGIFFDSLGTLVQALHTDTRINIVVNPKILTEDNNTAEIFVGQNTPFATQSIVNNNGNVVSQNVDYRDVGVRVRVTPLIANENSITLTIEEEQSSIVVINNLQGTPTSNGVPLPTTNVNRTLTRVHMPDGFFLIMSGMMQDTDTLTRIQVPCLGSIPFIGAAFSDRTRGDTKRNLMLFIRPKIIDTEEEIDNITKHQQDVFKYKNRQRDSWKYEVGEALDFFNLPDPNAPCDYERCEDCPL